MALEVWLKRVGQTLIPATQRDSEALLKCPEGSVLKFKTSGHRSLKHLNFFFAALAKALMNWPEAHEFQTKRVDRFRAWLLCKAGEEYREHLKYVCSSEDTAIEMTSIFNDVLEHLAVNSFAVHSGNKVWVLRPVSIAFEKMKQDEFNKVSQRVSDVLKEEIGMALDDFKKEVGKAA
ncbi:MAG: hypothetical protein DHS20C08_04300 [Rhodomicrobium sp.]|nr:MAG: hypothetical protein DHS20C08_04300 [Rhodomicrobium sp.]